MRILRMLATATAVAMVPLAANAAFEPQKEAPLGEYVSLECAITRTSDHGRDADPIYKINVELALTPRAQPTSLVVEHVSANGRRYSRDEQYTRSNLTFTPGRIEYYWNGTMLRNPAITMRGPGRVPRMISCCHPRSVASSSFMSRIPVTPFAT